MEERHKGADALKILATIFVVILHANGFLSESIPLGNFSYPVNITWHITEAAAYPAIHIFVMISAYFLIDAKNPVRGGINTWVQTVIFCLLGLLFAVILCVPFGIKEFIRSVFPFISRAYWYVSDYIVLLFLVPALNRILNGIDKKLLRYIVVVLFCLNSILPTFLVFFDWNQDYSNIGLFVLLYIIVAYIKKNEVRLSRLGGVFYGESLLFV